MITKPSVVIAHFNFFVVFFFFPLALLEYNWQVKMVYIQSVQCNGVFFFLSWVDLPVNNI